VKKPLTFSVNLLLAGLSVGFVSVLVLIVVVVVVLVVDEEVTRLCELQ